MRRTNRDRRAGRRPPRNRAAQRASPAYWMSAAYAAGKSAALQTDISGLQDHWVSFLRTIPFRQVPWKQYPALLGRFIAGYESSTGIKMWNGLWLPTRKSVAVVITVMNEEQIIERVIAELQRLPFDEVIFVVNGSTDSTLDKIRKYKKAIIQQYAAPLGHDVGRALGTRLSKADIILYLDGDFPVFAEHMLSFIFAVESGVDVALNDIEPFIDNFRNQDSVTRAKLFLNRVLGRADLKACSMTAVPHALSRNAVNQIGVSHLMIPPVAHAKAIMKGLVIQAAGSVDVIRVNRVRDNNIGFSNPVARMILGDHAEALAEVMKIWGARMREPDSIRKRTVIPADEVKYSR